MTKNANTAQKLDLSGKAGARFERKTRWRYQRDGKDFGPFSPSDLRTRMSNGEISEDTQVFEEGQQRWFRLGDVPEFAAAMFEIARERQRKLEHQQHEQVEAAMRSAHKTRGWISRVAIVAVLAAAGGTAWIVMNAHSGTPAAFAKSMYKTLELGEVHEWTPPTAESGFKLPIDKEILPEVAKPEKAARKSSGKRGDSASGSASGGGLVDSDKSGGAVVSGSSVTTMSFDDDSESGSRTLGAGEVQEVANRVAGKARGCFAAEVQRRPEFRGATLSFSIQPSGTLGGVRLQEGGMVTSALVSCVRKATGGVRIDPFAGGGRRIEIPIAVGAH
jgi:hypothetical protein